MNKSDYAIGHPFQMIIQSNRIGFILNYYDRIKEGNNVIEVLKKLCAMENSFKAGYDSEKITTCFIAVTIPIYFEDTTLYNFVNPKSFININHGII